MSAQHVGNIGGELDADILASRSVSDGVTTSGDATVTSATAAFTSADVGATISGTGIPADTTIASVTSATEIEMSAAATATDTGVTITIGDQIVLSSPALAALDAIASPDYMWICVDPDGINGEPEWMKVTAHTSAATTATVDRAQQSSTARDHNSGIEWVHTLAPTEADRLRVGQHKFVNPGADGASTTLVDTGGAWQALTSHVAEFVDLTLEDCQAGDVIKAALIAAWATEAQQAKLDVATVVGASLTNYFSSGAATPSAVGVRAFYGPASDGTYFGASMHYTLQPGDLTDGSATFRVLVNTDTGGRTLACSANSLWAVENIGPAQA